MKYAITGAAGHISKPLALALLAAGHEVTVIGRSAENLKVLTDKGAKAAIGSVNDVAFLTSVFEGKDAVYTMVPPDYGAADLKAHIHATDTRYAEAIKASGVKNVVNLSSVGAHLTNGAGPINGLHFGELELNKLDDVNILHLRPAYFYYNLLANLALIRNANIIGSNFSLAAGKFPIVHPSDIAEVAAKALLALDFKGHSHVYIASDEVGTDQIATEIGNAVGKPGIPWVQFPDDQAFQGMLGAGLGENLAQNYVEMGTGIQSGIINEDYFKQPNRVLGKTKLKDFAIEFAAAYNA
ncbi:NAD(P)H-binding protein [Pseudoflavitalea sp. G-6-1-2]|uniref:NmrA family NAD(P)-binding protein n=1 Tax=Pseudoflavitalea sp. G-6-1-2 TaxID=2728841 RepID=UPI00146DB6E4|nr:NAD(P)H-binding protein [Pseudoflavitalea sp. G-6-1-2]NML20536.1 NAD(P)H-binding protein [Pseudoflavitalea sp. G-6-1-2]